MKELKTYAHLYRTCQAQVVRGRWSGVIGTIRGVDEESLFLHKCKTNFTPGEDYLTDGRAFKIDEIKLILRPLSDMTENEKKEYNHRKQLKGYMPEVHADNTLWLLSKSFDLFGLIHAGLAVSKTETKN